MGSQIIHDHGLTKSATFPIQQDSLLVFSRVILDLSIGQLGREHGRRGVEIWH